VYQLSAAATLFELAPGPELAIWDGREFDLKTEGLRSWQQAAAKTTSARGARLHFQDDVRKLIRGGPGTIQSLIDLMGGGEPSDRLDVLAPTLARVPRDAGRPLWADLVARLFVTYTLKERQRYLGLGDSHFVLFGPMALAIAPSVLAIAPSVRDVLQEGVGRMFLRQEDMRDVATYDLASVVAQKPLSRISAREELFGGSAFSVADSIVPALESYFEAGRSAHPARVLVLSTPFEDEVRAFLTRLGFAAGEVDDGGTWRPLEGDERAFGTRPPGQIDVLAVREDRVLVLECKAMQPAGTLRQYVNSVHRISYSHHRNWHEKLRRKAHWVEGKLERSVDMVAFVVDRPIVIPDSDPREAGSCRIATLDELKAALVNLSQ
jgi:hypothetical protein